MALSSIDEERVLKALHSLDFALWPEVIRYIQLLQDQPQKKESHIAETMSAADLASSEIVGLWQDRTDVADNINFARQLRANAEQQRIKRHAAN